MLLSGLCISKLLLCSLLKYWRFGGIKHSFRREFHILYSTDHPVWVTKRKRVEVTRKEREGIRKADNTYMWKLYSVFSLINVGSAHARAGEKIIIWKEERKEEYVKRKEGKRRAIIVTGIAHRFSWGKVKDSLAFRFVDL